VNDTIGNNPEDKQLIDRILRGDTRAFGTIIRNTENLVAQIVFKMISSPEDRKDLAQDVYLKVYNNLSAFRFQSKLSTWIAQIAYNTCLSWIDKKKPQLAGNMNNEDFARRLSESRFDSSHGNESEAILSRRELSKILTREIDILPPLYKTLIVLYHNESMTYEELSQITELPTGTVKSYLFRARKMLKENLLIKYKKEAL
jgi:RNA polymerase sigma-70 factor (ECF subfamily)